MKRNRLIVTACVLAAVLLGLLWVAFMLKPRQTVNETTSTTTTTAPTQTTVAATTENTTQPTTEEATEAYVPVVSPDTVGLYIPADDGTRARALVTEFVSPRKEKTDIDCFEVIASQNARLEGSSFSGIWKDAWNSHENTQGAKIGFVIAFDLLNGERVEKTVLKPSDAKEFYDYLEIYLYDDIHQTPGVWYTHLEDGNMNDETIISSIKLTSGSQITQVGDITLTAFTYNGEDCFDEAGAYIGQAAYTIIVTQ